MRPFSGVAPLTRGRIPLSLDKGPPVLTHPTTRPFWISRGALTLYRVTSSGGNGQS